MNSADLSVGRKKVAIFKNNTRPITSPKTQREMPHRVELRGPSYASLTMVSLRTAACSTATGMARVDGKLVKTGHE